MSYLRALWSITAKDLRLLLRDRAAVFLTFAWPLLLASFFGALGPGFGAAFDDDEGDRAMTVLAVDEDQSPASAALLDELDAHPRVELERAAKTELDEAREQVRLGRRPAYLHIAAGYGDAPSPLVDPVAPPRFVTLGVDPRRASELEVLDAALERAAWRELGTQLPGATANPVPLTIEHESIRPGPAALDSQAEPPNPYAVTFPQGIIWAVLACAATFAVSLVSERSRGTLLRLAVAPISRLQILAGKALACLIAIAVMALVLIAVAVLGFGVRPQSWGLLALALSCTGLGFVGIMTLLAVLGRRTQSAAGLSWAILMSMAILGGGMLPLFMMPSWLQTAAQASPVAWALTAIEGAIWRGFSLAEMAGPCGALLLVGGLCLALGSRAVREL